MNEPNPASVIEAKPSSLWKAWRTLGFFVLASWILHCAASLRSELSLMSERVRYVDASMMVVAGSLFFVAGAGAIRHRKGVAELTMSFPGTRVWSSWYFRDPMRFFIFQAILTGFLAYLMGLISLIAAYVVLVDA